MLCSFFTLFSFYLVRKGKKNTFQSHIYIKVDKKQQNIRQRLVSIFRQVRLSFSFPSRMTLNVVYVCHNICLVWLKQTVRKYAYMHILDFFAFNSHLFIRHNFTFCCDVKCYLQLHKNNFFYKEYLLFSAAKTTPLFVQFKAK